MLTAERMKLKIEVYTEKCKVMNKEEKNCIQIHAYEITIITKNVSRKKYLEVTTQNPLKTSSSMLSNYKAISLQKKKSGMQPSSCLSPLISEKGTVVLREDIERTNKDNPSYGITKTQLEKQQRKGKVMAICKFLGKIGKFLHFL